jgi:hypothetical protein
VNEATGDLICWTDDDVLVDAEWLVAYCEAFAQWPKAAFFAGTIEPLYEIQPPVWVTENVHLLSGVLAIQSLDPLVRPLKDQEFPFGANMAIRIDAHRQRPFDSRLGPNGRQVTKGEETRLIEQLRGDGHYGVWVGPAKVRHWVPANRMTHRYLWAWLLEDGVAQARRDQFPGTRLFGMPRWLIRQWLGHAVSLLRGWLTFDYFMRVKAWCKLATIAGILCECRRQSKVMATTGSETGSPRARETIDAGRQ